MKCSAQVLGWRLFPGTDYDKRKPPGLASRRFGELRALPHAKQGGSKDDGQSLVPPSPKGLASQGVGVCRRDLGSGLTWNESSTQVTDGPDSRDPYEAVLADLRARRAQLDQTIKQLEAIRGGATPADETKTVLVSEGDARAVGDGEFLGLTIVDATKKLLAKKLRTLTSSEIVTFLKQGGVMMNSADPVNTVGAVLHRRSITAGDIVRPERGKWGLRDWYPNRRFPTKGQEATGEDE